MPSQKRWLDVVADRAPRWVLKAIGLCFLCGMLLGVHPVFNISAGVLCWLIGVVGMPLMMVAMYVREVRAREAAENSSTIETEVPSSRPGEEPGHRRWKHDVYDENAYAILGVPQDAPAADIRSAFKKLVLQYHPDTVPEEEKERAGLVFMRLDQAYQVLSNLQNRTRYDVWIERRYGHEPKLDDATRVFNDPQQRALFDAEYCPQLTSKGNDAEDQPASGPPEMPAETVASDPASSDVAPLEVDIPDAVREALELPGKVSSAPHPPSSEGTSLAIARCDRCGDLFETAATEALCERCRGQGTGSIPSGPS